MLNIKFISLGGCEGNLGGLEGLGGVSRLGSLGSLGSCMEVLAGFGWCGLSKWLCLGRQIKHSRKSS